MAYTELAQLSVNVGAQKNRHRMTSKIFTRKFAEILLRSTSPNTNFQLR
jgi:hypothetical protein